MPFSRSANRPGRGDDRAEAAGPVVIIEYRPAIEFPAPFGEQG